MVQRTKGVDAPPAPPPPEWNPLKRTASANNLGNFAGVKKHSHYKKDVSNLQFVDVYRVLDLFDVTHPAVQHAAKKVLCAGQRGAKDWEKDIQEAIDSLQRALDMHKEDGE